MAATNLERIKTLETAVDEIRADIADRDARAGTPDHRIDTLEKEYPQILDRITAIEAQLAPAETEAAESIEPPKADDVKKLSTAVKAIVEEMKPLAPDYPKLADIVKDIKD